ncbi:MAG: hypothetical protein QG629_403 [Patescibacteria group bacterium]|nr:hypothetical protein [Candidatus Saccharibacteria bacterium]MDQ5963321.1 hypothetical protein [Patescibacteria group bacterium]
MDKNESNSLESNSLESSEATSSLEASQSSPTDAAKTDVTSAKSGSFVEKITHRINIYLLLFLLLLLLAGVVIAVTYLASKRQDAAKVDTQSLSTETLKDLANNDVSVGQPKQVLSVQSNAVFAGRVLIRDRLEVAGPIQVGGALNVPGITVSGNSVFEAISVNKDLSVIGNIATQGQLSAQKGITSGGGGTFNGPVSAPAITTNNLQLNGNLNLTRHLAAGGANPARTNGPALGSGGTVAVSGSDIAGSINVNTGNGASAGCFVTVNFAQRYNNTPRVIVTPVGAAAGDIGMYVNRSTTSFSVCAAKAPPSLASFGFDYFTVE